MKLRATKTGDLDGQWKSGPWLSAKQTDGSQCGAYVLLVNMPYIYKL